MVSQLVTNNAAAKLKVGASEGHTGVIAAMN